MVKAIKAFFQSGHMLKSLNHTIISLIPKVELPTDLKQYRPISLCNVLDKVISKILANRLKPILELCISKNQSSFIPNRQILDNIIISHECLHFLKNKRQGNDGYTALKLDMSKAYDRVEWGYLKAVMEKMGFNQVWVEWIMECISSVSNSFNVNGEAKKYVIPARGIRQGDPLSPYLFLLCSEGLSSVLKNATRQGSISGLRISKHGLAITHLFFADDMLIFCKAVGAETRKLREILD